jgi:hypothetical protein
VTERDRVPVPSAHCIRLVARHQDLTQALAVMRNEEFGPEALRLRPARCKDGALARRVQIAVGGFGLVLPRACRYAMRSSLSATPAREQQGALPRPNRISPE